MEIAYIYFLLEGTSAGVLAKPAQQAKALEQLHTSNFDIIVISTIRNESQKHLKYIRIPSIKENPLYIFYYLFGKYFLIDKLADLKKYDYLIIRSPGPDPSIFSFLKKYNVVFEFHSKVIQEVRMKLKDNVSYIRKCVRLINLFFLTKYLFKSLRFAKGLLVNSGELRSYFIKNSYKKIPSKMVSNGVDVENISITGFKRFDGNNLNLAIVASRADQWHGINRLLNSARHYLLKKNNIVINIHLIGGISRKDIYDENIENINIFFHGLRFGNELDEIISGMNLAVCPLALYKKYLDETSAIKVAEYFARGIPFIIGYKDSGIRYSDFNENNKCFLEFPNDDSIIDFSEIIDFAKLVSSKRKNVIRGMRSYAKKYFDWNVKIKEYMQFISQLEKQ